jgi:hypothetical protein
MPREPSYPSQLNRADGSEGSVVSSRIRCYALDERIAHASLRSIPSATLTIAPLEAGQFRR